MQWCVDNDFCGEAAKAVRYDSDFVWESESWPAGEYIVSEKDRNAEKFPFSTVGKDGRVIEKLKEILEKYLEGASPKYYPPVENLLDLI